MENNLKNLILKIARYYFSDFAKKEDFDFDNLDEDYM